MKDDAVTTASASTNAPADQINQTTILSLGLDESESTALDSASPLATYNLSHFFGSDGPLAAELAGYELRPSQLAMAEALQRAILAQQHALIEAPTGTGKSIAYLVPAILSGKTVVVATANKSLQSQLFYQDIPFLRRVFDRPISAVIVKGRSNFICNYKWEKEAAAQQQIALYDRENEQIKFIHNWLDETETGDVDDLPFMLEGDLRPRIVSYPDDCLHDDCRFYYDDCWVNHMRDQAAEAQIIITNHHLLLNALELGWAGERLLPPAAIYIIDEAHGLEQTATAVFETSVSDYTVEQLLSRTIFREHVEESEIDEWRFQNTLAFQEVSHLSRDNAFRIDSELEEMKKLSRGLSALSQKLKLNHPFAKGETDKLATMPSDGVSTSGKKLGYTSSKKGNNKVLDEAEVAEQRRAYDLAIEALNSTATKLLTVAVSSRHESLVRYAVRVFDRRHTTLELHAAPINPASYLRDVLFHPEDTEEKNEEESAEAEANNAVRRTVICTSATLATNGHFQHFRQRCGIDEAGEEQILPAVFDYPKQALLYQPPIPAFDYRNPDPYYTRISGEIDRLLQVSRGRALCLFTSWSGLQQVKDRLTAVDSQTVWPLRAQGDAPRDALLTWFKETEHSVLLATRSFWEGVDIPGDDLSLVVLDKMPFPTPNDPLHSARMKLLDDSGSSSFGEYMVPLMNLALKQGFGRLIRRATDSGVVAILDERLSSKGYGRQTRQDLPPARFSREFKDVHKFYQTVLDTSVEFALNVWAWRGRGDPLAEDEITKAGAIHWRWQLLRLQDGKADSMADSMADQPASPLATLADAELYAAQQGLENLRDRITRAGRAPAEFAVEVRSHWINAQISTTPATDIFTDTFYLPWQAECAHWRQVAVVTLTADI
ncbi:MAG: ATP-dependent DNA helicase [Caldilineaceae bacterium]